jgi:archaellum component FlaC
MQEQLQNIKNNLDRLLRNYHAVKNENNILKSQLDAQRKSTQDKNKKIEELEKQIELMKTVQTIAEGTNGEESNPGKAEMKKKINELIKEVDNCIALLND